MMTGPCESQLAEIVDAPDWNIPNIDQLGEALATLNRNLAALAESPGGTGNWAKAASDSFLALQDEYKDLNRHTLLPIRRAITVANEAKEQARQTYAKLPGVSVPWAITEAVALGVPMLVPMLGPVPLAATLVIGLFENALGNQREDQAKAALAALHRDLKNPTDDLTLLTPRPASRFHDGEVTRIDPAPAVSITGEGGSGGSNYSSSHSGYSAAIAGTGGGNAEAGTGLSGSYGGSSADSGIGYSGGGGSGAAGYGSTSADGDLSGGTVPGTGFNGGIGLAGSGGGLGGEGLRGLGIGAGSAASAAAVAAAARMGGLGNLGSGSLGGGGLGGGTGGGLRVGGLGAAAGKGGSGGTGGLLGSGAKATVAAGSAEEGAGGAAGSKSGNSMMGGQGGQGGTNKEKRSGLGGFIAPKLEDDEELGPRSAGASAGGRDAARE